MRFLALFGVVGGVFWVGRESAHGLTAFWHHWWCPLPLVLVAAGGALYATARRVRPS